MSKYDGGCAFPSEFSDPHGRVAPEFNYGMSLRDYFAAKTLSSPFIHGQTPKFIAECCYEIADAMLEARKQ